MHFDHGALDLNSERQTLGVEFTDRAPGQVFLEVNGKGRLDYQLILTIPFNSTRKRMSVIVQAPDGSYVLYCKVSDAVVM